MHDLSKLEHMSKEQREAYILAMKPPATATEEDRQRFELLRQIELLQTILHNILHTLAGNLQGDETLLLFRPESLGLQIDSKNTLGAFLGMGNIVSYHSLSTCNLTNLCHCI